MMTLKITWTRKNNSNNCKETASQLAEEISGIPVGLVA